MSGPNLFKGLGDVISGGKELYDKIYHAMGGDDNYDSYGNSGGGYGRNYSGDYDSYSFNTNFGNFGAHFDEFGYEFVTFDNNDYDEPRTEPDIFSENIAIVCNVDPKIYCRKGIIEIETSSNINLNTGEEIVRRYMYDRLKYGFKIKRLEYDEYKQEIYVTLTKQNIILTHTFDII